MAIDPMKTVSLSAHEAETLVARNVPIHLPDLKVLDPPAASVLAQANQGIVLRGLTALTVATAEALAPHKWGLHLTGMIRISREVGDALATHNGTLKFGTSLRDLRSPLLAERLGRQNPLDIALDGIEVLLPEIARALMRHSSDAGVRCSVSLNGLRYLYAETAAELTARCGAIAMQSLSNGQCILEGGAEELLADFGSYEENKLVVGHDLTGFLSQNYSEELLTAGVLAFNSETDGYRDYDELELDSLQSLSPKQANAISAFDGNYIYLRGLADIPNDIACILGSKVHDGTHIAINPRRLIDPDVVSLYVDAFRDCPEHFFSDPPAAIEELSRDAAELLVRAQPSDDKRYGYDQYSMSFPSLRSLPIEVAEILATSKSPLWLDGLEELSTEVAAALATHRHGLSLDGLRTISFEALCLLAEGNAPLRTVSLNGLQDVSLPCQALLGHPRFDRSQARSSSVEIDNRGCTYNSATTMSLAEAQLLPLEDLEMCFYRLTELTPEVATYFASTFLKLSCPSLESLSEAAAEALQGHCRPLYLDGLTCINTGVAKALAKHQGLGLGLRGITALMPEEAKALAKYRNSLLLDGLTYLAPEAAAALAKHIEWPRKQQG
jgi:hypothetical protein